MAGPTRIGFLIPTGRPGCEACANKLPAAEAVLMPGPSELPSADPAGQAVDYKKLIDLDASDVLANADGFDCPVCMMGRLQRSGRHPQGMSTQFLQVS